MNSERPVEPKVCGVDTPPMNITPVEQVPDAQMPAQPEQPAKPREVTFNRGMVIEIEGVRFRIHDMNPKKKEIRLRMIQQPRCKRCGAKLERGDTDGLCGQCREKAQK